MPREAVHLWRTRVKRAGIMPMASSSLPQRATPFSDGAAIVSRSSSSPEGRDTALTLRKTRNQLSGQQPRGAPAESR